MNLVPFKATLCGPVQGVGRNGRALLSILSISSITSIMKNITFVLACMLFCCFSAAVAEEKESIATITVEHALSPQQHAWGFMGRKKLPADHGMLFHFKKSKIRSFWMFNCYVDLSVAYLNEEGIILEIHQMKAHPEMMDPKRPITKLQDLSQYPLNDPVLRFFAEHSANSAAPCSYALEVPLGYFEKHGIEKGDALQFSNASPYASFVKAKKSRP